MKRRKKNNRWVRPAKFIPWEKLGVGYSKSLKGSGSCPPAMSARVALGSLIIKERLGTSDEETVEQIRGNPYLQYFLGFKSYKDEEPFHSTMSVHFRKRIRNQMIERLNVPVKLIPFPLTAGGLQLIIQ